MTLGRIRRYHIGTAVKWPMLRDVFRLHDIYAEVASPVMTFAQCREVQYAKQQKHHGKYPVPARLVNLLCVNPDYFPLLPF